MEKLHHYSASIKWTGNLGTGTSTYRAYSRNYERLVGLKNKYDPTNLFRMNQNIKPTV